MCYKSKTISSIPFPERNRKTTAACIACGKYICRPSQGKGNGTVVLELNFFSGIGQMHEIIFLLIRSLLAKKQHFSLTKTHYFIDPSMHAKAIF